MVDIAAARESLPLRLDELREVKPDKAAWIEDVYSEVFRQLRANNVKDEEMVAWLIEALDYHMRDSQQTKSTR